MRINLPPANLLPARLSNLCPVSARIGDRQQRAARASRTLPKDLHDEIFVNRLTGPGWGLLARRGVAVEN